MKAYEQAEKLSVDDFNKLIIGTPNICQGYHLYVGNNQDEKFLSLIPSSSWDAEHVGSFKLNHEKIWERVEARS
jgi:hypothetical protein